jgi:hypothetical protein
MAMTFVYALRIAANHNETFVIDEVETNVEDKAA